jgi:hypothetical protein
MLTLLTDFPDDLLAVSASGEVTAQKEMGLLDVI